MRRTAGRTCESLVGNVVTDAMRTKYAAIGVEFAITNSGGLRDPDLSDGGHRGDFPASYSPPPFPITRGRDLEVLPFGNIVVTLDINGSEPKAMLENGVSLMPAVAAASAALRALLHLRRPRRPAAVWPARCRPTKPATAPARRST